MDTDLPPATRKEFPVGRALALVTLGVCAYLAFYVGEPFLHWRTPLYQGFHLDHWIQAAQSESPAESADAAQVLAEVYPARTDVMCCSPFCIFDRSFVREMRMWDNARAEMKAKIDQITTCLIRAAHSEDETVRAAAIKSLALVGYHSADEPATQILPVLLPSANDTDATLRSIVRTCIVSIAAEMAVRRDPMPTTTAELVPLLILARNDAKLRHGAELALAYFAPENGE